MKKYKFTEETKVVAGHTLHRIRALKDFSNVKAGDLGGFIESENNLSHNGTCWVYDNAKVYDYAQVYGDAKVCDTADVHGYVVISEGLVNGDADVC